MELSVHAAGELKFAVDCKVNPGTLVGHVRITLDPNHAMFSCGATIDGNEILNNVPLPEPPPE